MNRLRRILAVVLMALTLGQITWQATACGPSVIEPIFVFENSPDLPFENFIRGNLGIVQPTFGRKTLVIAYRYLNGGTFAEDEQGELVKALEGSLPEDDGTGALKTWIATRKGFLKEGEILPEIYAERQYGGYDYFPNCTKNAFEVATQTLKDRASSYGADSAGTSEWLDAQDKVFKNCLSGSTLPEELGSEKPEWLRKDRDYQIGAALLYSLSFDQARSRFEKIATDNESPWQETAEYLVPRTLVRQASLSQNDERKRELYEQAEIHLLTLLGKGGKFHGASQRMLGLVKYRLHPEERVRELARSLAAQNGDENLRQDLVDYVWLLDKFESRILKEEERKKDPTGEKEEPDPWYNQAAKERYEAIERGDVIEVRIYFKKPDGTPDYSNGGLGFEFKNDVTESEIFAAFELELGRKVTPEEAQDIKASHKLALSHREFLTGPNRQWRVREHEGEAAPGKLSPNLLPDFLGSDDLTDWIFTVQTRDPAGYSHAFKRWRDTDSDAWLMAALIKAERTSPGLERLMRAAERVDRQAPAFASSVYHRIRLKIAAGKEAEARLLLDELTASGLDRFPISARNLFGEQRMRLAKDLKVFLKSGLRLPVAFYNKGRLGGLSVIQHSEESEWNPEDFNGSREEFERREEEGNKEFLLWNDRPVFDPKTTEIINTYFPLPTLIDVARSSAVPDYLQRRISMAVWTRAVLLKNLEMADQVVPDVVRSAPELKQLFEPYRMARTPVAKQQAALFIILKLPVLSPFVADGLPILFELEDQSYYYETSWWCPSSDTDYNDEGEEIPRNVSRPGFLSADQLASAKRDQSVLKAIGDAKPYLGKRVLEWARSTPNDPRLPEALFIAAKANGQYKYGCSSWEHDVKTKTELEKLLRSRYPASPWAAKLNEPQN